MGSGVQGSLSHMPRPSLNPFCLLVPVCNRRLVQSAKREVMGQDQAQPISPGLDLWNTPRESGGRTRKRPLMGERS